MALDTTVGGYKADSFVEIVEADTYVAAYDEASPWLDYTDSAKEFRLRTAAQFISILPLRGYKVYEYQSLCFPRSVQTNVEEIPDSVKETQALLAYLVIDKNIQESESTSEGGGQILDEPLVKSVEVMGVMRVGLQTTIDTRSTKNVSPTLFARYLQAYAAPVWMLIRPYLSQVRGGIPPIVVGPNDVYDRFGDLVISGNTGFHRLLASPDYDYD